MRMLCRRAGSLTLYFAILGTTVCSGSDDVDGAPDGAQEPYPDPAASALLDEYEDAAAATSNLLVRARTAAARLRTDALPEELEPLDREMRLCVQALGLQPDAAEHPWGDWIAADRAETPALAAEMLRAADHVLDAEAAMILARGNDRREIALSLRLQAHRVMWHRDPAFAEARARSALFRETPRDRDYFRPALVEKLLVPRRDAATDRLLLEVAAEDQMETRARRLAIRGLSDRDVPGAAAICESIFDTEAADLLIRQEALRAIVALEPDRARRVLDEKLPPREIEPTLHGFMIDLRASLDVADDA